MLGADHATVADCMNKEEYQDGYFDKYSKGYIYHERQFALML